MDNMGNTKVIDNFMAFAKVGFTLRHKSLLRNGQVDIKKLEGDKVAIYFYSDDHVLTIIADASTIEVFKDE